MVDDGGAAVAAIDSPIITSAHKVAIAGLGLIGGSLARRLVERGRFVVAWNHNDGPYEAARAAGMRTVDSLEALAQEKPDVLVLATPLTAIPDVLKRLRPVLLPTTTLTDVGSVKGPVRAQVKDAGLIRQYVGAHPMTGNEFSGFEASSSTLFGDALWALCVEDSTEMSRFLTVADMITQGLRNRFICIDDSTHDRSAALISHMPHVVATALAALLSVAPDRDIAAALSAGSWRDMTRVALTDPARTEAMVVEDAKYVADLLQVLSTKLSGVATSLSSVAQDKREIPADFPEIRSFFESAQPYRNYKKNQARSAASAEESPLTTITLTDQQWQKELLQSARQGQQIVRLISTHEFQVTSAPSW